ncbi:MAG: haloacid dehalogenase-like hydrolase [Candidatus Binatia bacterium]
MQPTVLLFDVDGTLVTTPGAGRRALERAFGRRFGSATALRGIHFGGMTDPAIVRAGLAAAGRVVEGAEGEATIRDLLERDYLPLLAEEVARADLRLHRGIREALDAVAGEPGVAVGLGTGNVRAGAEIKLTRVGVYERFAFGGFGCDHEDRAELLRIGAARGAALLGVPFGAARVVVIGDTPRDMAAARAIGATAVGVGTCGWTPARLREHGATWAFDDLAEPGALAALLGSPGGVRQ